MLWCVVLKRRFLFVEECPFEKNGTRLRFLRVKRQPALKEHAGGAAIDGTKQGLIDAMNDSDPNNQLALSIDLPYL